jgi:hypothetical protein
MKRVMELLADHAKINWVDFFDLASENSATLLTSQNLARLGAKPPGLSDFDAKNQKVIWAAAERSRLAGEFLRLAHEASIEVILLKGALLGSALYGNPQYKKMNDIDVLVKREDAPRFADLLRSLKFMSVGHLLGSEEFDDSSHHCPPFVSEDSRSVVGIHWGLTSPYSVWRPDLDSIWKNRAPVEAFGTQAFRMSWEETLLHLCIHLPFFKIGVRELADVYNLGLECALDWPRFGSLVKKWKAEDAAYRVISLSNRLVSFSPPEGLLRDWKEKASRFTVHDTEFRLSMGREFVRTRSTHIGKIEKSFAILRLSSNYAERVGAWANTWRLTFYPPAKELRKIIPEEKGFLARLKVGNRVWQAMARDYGQAILIVLTLQNIGLVLKETLLRPFKPVGVRMRDSASGRLLESLE